MRNQSDKEVVAVRSDGALGGKRESESEREGKKKRKKKVILSPYLSH